MQTSIKRRVLGVLSVVLASQLLSACVVLPLPGHHRHRAVVVQPAPVYVPGPHYRDPYWRR